MRKIIIIIVFLFLPIVGCQQLIIPQGTQAQPRNTPIFEEWEVPSTFVPISLYVLGLGDSLTVGVGDELKQGGYIGRLAVTMDEWHGIKEVQFENLAKTGRRSDQLLKQLENPKIQRKIKKANLIYLTIGGNDLISVFKRDLFHLKVQPFYDELAQFEGRLNEIFTIIRTLNGDAAIIVSGLYNPFSIISQEPIELKRIINSWNEAIEVQTVLDYKSCFVPIEDLFHSNENMVYHTDFFHPNAKGYDEMTIRYIDRINQCNFIEKFNEQFES